MEPLLFRCSRLGDLMTNPRNKSDKISQTTKTLCSDMFLQNEYGYKEQAITDAMTKGNLCESDSRILIKNVIGGEFRKRFAERLSNDFIIGTPDIVLQKEDVVEDIKNSFTLKTFHNADLAKAYYWQGQGYLWLTGKSNYRLIYTLNKTPESMILEQKKRYYFKFDCDESNEDYLAISAQIDLNNDLIDRIPLSDRVKVFNFIRNDDEIELLKNRIGDAREYYKTLKL